MSRLACINVDLDELVHYARIHGLPEAAAGAPALVHRLGGQRFGELLERHGLKGTAFVIGEAVSADTPGGEQAAAVVRRLAEAGHELANHTYGHDYRLTARDRTEMDAEVARGADALQAVTGRRPVGFRAPGYHVDERLFDALRTQGYRYDSSVFPSAAYYAARAGVLATMRLFGRPSHTRMGRPEALLAPTAPYRPRPESFWRPGGTDLVELPIAVVPGTGMPFIGTSLTSLPWPTVLGGWRLLRRRDFVNLELHGIDFLDRDDGVAPALVQRQPDLRIRLSEKLRRLDAILHRLTDSYEVVTLAEAAERLFPG